MKNHVRDQRCERLVSLPIDPAALCSHYFIKSKVRCVCALSMGRREQAALGEIRAGASQGGPEPDLRFMVRVMTVPDLVEQNNGD